MKPNLKFLAITTIFITALRLFYIHLGQFPLFFDEAQYWTWSRDLNLGYYSKPPMIAWLIRLGSEICGGNSIFCVKLFAPILHGLISLVIFVTARRLYNEEVGFWAGLSWLIMPGVAIGSVLISADVPLLFFWSLAFYCFVRAVEAEQDYWWLILGAVAGLGLLSKYTMGAFGVSALLFMLSSSKSRKLFLAMPLWLGVLLAASVFAPNILWNYTYDFPSFSHTSENMLSGGVAFYPLKFIEFLGAQFGIFGPVFFVILLYITAKLKHDWKDDNAKMLGFFSLIVLLAGLVIAMISGAQAHWSAPAYITGTIWVVSRIIESGRYKLLYASLIINVIFMACFMHYQQLQKLLPASVPNLYERAERWNNIAPIASVLLHKNKGSLLLTDERKILAPLSYNLNIDGAPYPVIKWPSHGGIKDHYDMKSPLYNGLIGYDMLFITRGGNANSQAPYFKKVRSVTSHDIAGQNFQFYLLSGFKGF